ncbi:MAG: DUF1570 domain-containing protein [Planctomycetota bacterium]
MRNAFFCALLAVLPRPVDGEAQLVDALKRVERTLATQRYVAAREEVLACLAPHAGETYVLHHWNAIASVLERATFGARYPAPDPAQLVGGTVRAYSASRGTLELEYTTPRQKGKAGSGLDLSDFQRAGELVLHPVVFDGPYTIEIEIGAAPALASGTTPPAILCGIEFGESLVVSFGLASGASDSPSARVSSRSAAAHNQGGVTTALANSAVALAPGVPYALKVVVDSASIQAFANGELALAAKKPEGLFGRFGWTGLPDVRRVRIQGKVQPSWLQGVADAAVQKQRATFEATYDAVADAPTWLRARLLEHSPALPSFEHVFPAPDHEARQETLARVREFLDTHDATGGLAYVRSIPDARTTPALRAWTEAALLEDAGALQGALDAARKVLAIDARFTPARALAVRALAQLQQRAAAIEDCRTWLAQEPERPEPYAQLAALYLYDDRANEARATLRAAVEAGIPPGDLLEVDRVIARAENGPPWLTSYVHRSAHYEVRSDMGQRVCVLAATELEKFYVKYSAHLRRAPRGERRLFRVYIFSGQAGYLAYTQDLLGEQPEHTAGLYSPSLKQLLIWNVPTFDELLRTVRHEGFHQFLDRFASDVPRWLDEGLAQYYETSKPVGGGWEDGALAPLHVARLRKLALAPLATFLAQDDAHFYADAERDRNYAQAWAFVHFLQHSSHENRRLLERLLDLIVTGTRPGDAVARVFDARNVAVLERDFAAYVQTLR